MSELKPCPFCGSASAPLVLTVAELEMLGDESADYEWACMHWAVVCDFRNDGCGATTGLGHDSDDAAATAWNRRAGEDG